MNEHSHRPSALKQQNKAHKSNKKRAHGPKFGINSKNVGQDDIHSLSKLCKSSKRNKDLGRIQRRNQSSQIRRNKRNAVLDEKRKIGGIDTCPLQVCILPLNKDLDPQTIMTLLMQCDANAVIQKSPQGATHAYIPRFKQRFSFIVPKLTESNHFGILDALKVCDSVLLLASAAMDEAVDEWGKNILSSALAQGLPTPIIVLTNMESVPQKQKQKYKKSIESSLSRWFPNDKLFNLETESEGINLLRKIGEQKRSPMQYRDRRPFMYAEDAEFVPDSQGGPLGTLKVTGFLRGTPLSVNKLVHLPGLGDFQMLQIDGLPDPYKVSTCEERRVLKVLAVSNPSKQESLESEMIPESMDCEQTWPTEEEIRLAREEQKVKKVGPKGWSDYQTAWIDGDDKEFVSSDSEDDNEEMDAIPYENPEESEDEEAYETMTQSDVPVDAERYDQEMDVEDEKNAMEMLKLAKDDALFPDEIDTPMDLLAKDRFQKYRGMESFRTSPWDPNENLPIDYERILIIDNMKRYKKQVLEDSETEDGVLPGWYITVHIKNVSEFAWNAFKGKELPLTLFGLLPNEQKMTVLNTVLKRTNQYGLPIKSKSKLIFQCGYRRFAVCPIFNEHVEQTNKKFIRYFQPESIAVATFYAPIQLSSAPVLCYKEVNNELALVATGSLLSCDPRRIILKRVALSGHPFKIFKRSSVVRFMFFNREDIFHFKQVKLKTKMGKFGHIKEPLGTHGHMKCIFNGQLNAQDTVFMYLYKRVFPKWTYDNLVNCIESSSMDIQDGNQNM